MLEKDSFILFTEYTEEISMLSDEAAGQLMKAIFAYETTGETPEIFGEARLLFSIFKRRLDDNRIKYREKCQRNAKIGKKGGRPKKEATPDFEKPRKANSFSENPEKANGFFKNPEKADTDLDLDLDTEGQRKKGKSDTAEGAAGRARPSPAKFSPEDHAYQAAVYLDRQIQARLEGQKSVGEKRLQAWAVEFDRCHRLDGHSWEDISKVLRFSQKDPFWAQNILSGGKFRDKYLQLLAKMQTSAAGKAQLQPAEKSYDIQELEELAGLRLPEKL